MTSLADVLPALKTLYTGKSGLTTVRGTVPPVDPEADDLPMVFFDVREPSSEATSHRRTLLWPIDVYCLVRIKTENLEADLEAVYPWPERIIGWLDEQIALGGILAGSARYQVPMMDEIGPIRLRKKTYIGFITHPIFPVKVERTFHP